MVVTARNEVTAENGFCISVQKPGMSEGREQKLHLSLELWWGKLMTMEKQNVGWKTKMLSSVWAKCRWCFH